MSAGISGGAAQATGVATFSTGALTNSGQQRHGDLYGNGNECSSVIQ
ncbi:MAG: hypothetical protein IPO04_01075 [Cytophagaceae bacterium]|nr:hypothetical protein [Cytophagaceae bacterium]